MQDESISVEKLREIFSLSTGERTIEVTEDEYQKIYHEALEKGLELNKKVDSFSLKLDNLVLTIVRDYDEDEDEYDEELEELE